MVSAKRAIKPRLPGEAAWCRRGAPPAGRVMCCCVVTPPWMLQPTCCRAHRCAVQTRQSSRVCTPAKHGAPARLCPRSASPQRCARSTALQTVHTRQLSCSKQASAANVHCAALRCLRWLLAVVATHARKEVGKLLAQWRPTCHGRFGPPRCGSTCDRRTADWSMVRIGSTTLFANFKKAHAQLSHPGPK